MITELSGTLMQWWQSECWLDLAKGGWVGGRDSSISCFWENIDPISKTFEN